jgi:2-polyprenyl-6-methoxyphenol hydroxylase-like FAD-dependent oxidoreductase
MTSALRVDIVGGGIGGLTLAAALAHFGVEFRVFEQAPELRAVGYGLTLQRNALQALDTIGLGAGLRALGTEIRQGALRFPDGKTLTPMSLELCAIHRATLLAGLAANVPPSALRLGERVEGPTDADFIVAADGLHSVFRKRIAGEEGALRDGGCTAWRGVAPRTLETTAGVDLAGVSETWGKGTRLGIVPIDGERLYWFAVAPIMPLGDAEKSKAFILETFANYHAPARALIEATPADTILETRIADRPPIPRWHDGNVVLLGDAAHPMTPNLGQGGCQAVEDAIVLGHLLHAVKQQELPREALAPAYEKARRSRAYEIVERSFSFGRMANLENPVAVWLRNLAVRLTPASVQAKQLERILTFPGVGSDSVQR